MNRIAPIATLAVICAACSSTKSGQYGSEQEFNANCRVRDDQISIEIQTNGQPISNLELVLQDGSIIHPEIVRGPRGKEVALGIINDGSETGSTLDTHNQPSTLKVSFPKSAGSSGPRQLVLTPTDGGRSSILLAKVEGQSVDSRFAAFGYTRELRTFPDGSKETIYVRTESDGTRHEVDREDFEQGVSNSISAIYSALPDTAKEMSDTPGVTQFLAELFEQGCQYSGDMPAGEANPLPDPNQFSSKQVRVLNYDRQGREERHEDPLSTVTRLLVNALNSADADELHQLHERVRSGECDEAEFVHTEATYKARSIKRAMDVLRDNVDGLSVSDWKDKKYGHYFTLYMSWVREAESESTSEEATLSRLTGIVLQSLTRKGLRSGEKPIAYRLKLQRQYSALNSEFDKE